MNIYPVILCGRSGTRLWPMSRGGYPKQCLKLIGEHTLVQQTALRLRDIDNVAAPIVITNEEQRFLVAEQLRNVDVRPSAIVLEPVGRDMAPAVVVAALLAQQATPEALLLILPSDHVIEDDVVFGKLTTVAASVTKDNSLVTFGIEPTEPHTRYGYIRGGEAPVAVDGTYRVERFVEKPDAVTAARLLEEGGYYWNSGMFMLKAAVYLDEFRQYVSEILRQVELALNAAKYDTDFVRLNAEAFGASPRLSIDYAIMGKTAHAAVVTVAGLGQNDTGSWTTLAETANVDDNGNALFGDVLVEDMRNTYVRVKHRMVVAVGVNDLVIVETVDAILASHRDRARDVKKIVERLNSLGRRESVTHRKVFRLWGSYEGIDRGECFQVKRIIVNPGSSLSLQMRHHRAEHWIMVYGTAKVLNGDQVMLLSENQSTHVPLGVTHRLENPGKIPLELIEVQSGFCLGEDDIVRFQDHYGRVAQARSRP